MKDWTTMDEWRNVAQRAERIFSTWLETGQLTMSDVFRVFNARYHYFVTFKIGNNYGVITDAENMDEAYEVAKKVYGDAVHSLYVEYMFNPKLYPGGEVSRHKAGDGEPVALDG